MKKRREFLKTTGAALGGIAISGIIPAEAAAEPQKTAVAPAAAQSMQTKAMRAGTINIHAAHGVKLANLQEALAQAVGKAGCPACGLLGVDIHIGPGDPEPFLNLPGINATFTARG
ncbi:MAG: hypothetical protein LAP21_01320 [Acidobacteriia bacterium]|nr:hypothetical protein [Terriglobia bacterium]